VERSRSGVERQPQPAGRSVAFQEASVDLVYGVAEKRVAFSSLV
jgi:hypothetical protein